MLKDFEITDTELNELKVNDFDDFDTQVQSDELNPDDYDNWLDLVSGRLEDEEIECWKCGAFIKPVEQVINDDKCPCCDSPLQPDGIDICTALKW